MTTAEMESKIRRLDNDVHSIYGLLSDIQKTQRGHGERLDGLAAGQTRIQSVLARQGNRLNEHAAQLEEITANQSAIQTTQARHGNRLDEHSVKLDTILDLLRGRPTEEIARQS